MWNDLISALEVVFGEDVPTKELLWSQVAARAVLVYLIGLLIVRLGKSRLLGGATALDIILVVILGSLLSRGITGKASLTATVTACVVLVAWHWLMTYLTCRWHGFGNLVKGHSYLLVENGHINWEAMRHAHLSEHDLLEQLRLHAHVEDLDQIEKAYKERSGQISAIRRSR